MLTVANRLLLLLLVTFMAVGITVVRAQGSATPLALTLPTSDTINSLLQSMNAARQNVNPAAASPIPNLAYSNDVQTSASNFAQRCLFDATAQQPLAQHSNSSDRTITYNGQPNTILGENLYWSYRQGTTCDANSGQQSLVASVPAWNSEQSSYQVGCPTTNSQNVIGHYSQIIWSTTNGVGCAAECCNVKTSNNVSYAVQLVVCQFGPAGNINGYDMTYTPACAPTCRAGETNLYTNQPSCSSTTSSSAATTSTTIATAATSPPTTTTTTTQPISPSPSSTTTTTTTTTTKPTITSSTTTTTPTPTTTTTTSTTTTITTTAAPASRTARPVALSLLIASTMQPLPKAAACPSRILRGAIGRRWVRDVRSGSCYMFVNVARLGSTGYVPYTDVLRLSTFSTKYGSSHEVIVSSAAENMRLARITKAVANGVDGFKPAAGETTPSFFKIGVEHFSDVGEWQWTQASGTGPSFRWFGATSIGQCVMSPPVHQTHRDCAYYNSASGTGSKVKFWQTQSCDNYRSLAGYVLIAEVPISDANQDGPTEPAVQLGTSSSRRRSKLPQFRVIHDSADEDQRSMVDSGLVIESARDGRAELVQDADNQEQHSMAGNGLVVESANDESLEL